MNMQTTTPRFVAASFVLAVLVFTTGLSAAVADDDVAAQIEQERAKLRQSEVVLQQEAVEYLRRLAAKGLAGKAELKAAELRLEAARAALEEGVNSKEASRLARVKLLEAAVVEQEARFEHVKRLNQKGLAADLELKQAEIELAATRARLAAEGEGRQEIQQERNKLLESQLELKQQDLQRLHALARNDAVSETEVSKAELEVSIAQMRLAEAKNDGKTVVAALQAAYQLREAQLRRLEQLQKSGVIAASKVEESRQELIAAKLQMLEAKQALETAALAGDDPQLRKLLVERRDVLAERLKLLVAQFHEGAKGIEPVLHAASQLTDAELEIAFRREDRVKLLERQVATARDLENVAQRQFDAGQTGRHDLLAARAARLAAQIRLARETTAPDVNDQPAVN